MDQDDIGVTLQQSLKKTGSCYRGIQLALSFKNILGGCGSAKNQINKSIV